MLCPFHINNKHRSIMFSVCMSTVGGHHFLQYILTATCRGRARNMAKWPRSVLGSSKANTVTLAATVDTVDEELIRSERGLSSDDIDMSYPCTVRPSAVSRNESSMLDQSHRHTKGKPAICHHVLNEPQSKDGTLSGETHTREHQQSLLVGMLVSVLLVCCT